MSVTIAGRLAFALAGGAAITSSTAVANDFTAEKVMRQMTPEQRHMYVVGVIEGLAVARYMRDGQKPEGMNCIYEWYYSTTPLQTLNMIYAAFERYLTYPPGSIIYTLAKQRCGE